jgi:hypothetical protein
MVSVQHAKIKSQFQIGMIGAADRASWLAIRWHRARQARM